MGKISYSCLAEYFKKKLKSLGFLVELFGLHDLRSGEAMAQQMLGCLISLFRGAAGGVQRTLRMAMLKTSWRIGVQFRKHWPNTSTRLPSLWHYSWSL